MAQTKQVTLKVGDEKVVLKARRLSTGVGGIRYFVSVKWSAMSNEWRSKVIVRLGELDSASNMVNQALELALEKGLAKWLKATH